MLAQRLLICALVWTVFGAAPSLAQNPFAPVIQVNEDVITAYELEQRELFLRVISPANSGREVARREIVNDRLREQAFQQVGIAITEADVDAGMEEFASRANLTKDEFLQAIAARGVEPETFRDFISVGLGWRDLIRARFGNRISVTEAQIDRALAAAGTGSGVRVLLSEIIMPAPPGQQEAVLARAERIAQAKTIAEFSAFARQYSATPTRGRGGRLDWTPLSRLPAPLRPVLLSLAPGEVTSPLPLPNAVALFQLRAIEETDAPAVTYAAIEYAEFLIPGGGSDAARAEATRITNSVDVCDDLYGIALGLPEERLIRDTKAPADIPEDLALELAKLDENELSASLVTGDGQFLRLIMLCGRTTEQAEDISREQVAETLRQDRLNRLADSYLEELRADARIRDKSSE